MCLYFVICKGLFLLNFSIVSNRRPYREYYVDALGEPSEKTWVAGKAIVLFEGRHQFEELPVLRRRGKQKEKGYKHKVKDLFSLWFWFFESAQYRVFLDARNSTSAAFFCGSDCSITAREVVLCIITMSKVHKLPGVSRHSFILGCDLLFLLPQTGGVRSLLVRCVQQRSPLLMSITARF